MQHDTNVVISDGISSAAGDTTPVTDAHVALKQEANDSMAHRLRGAFCNTVAACIAGIASTSISFGSLSMFSVCADCEAALADTVTVLDISGRGLAKSDGVFLTYALTRLHPLKALDLSRNGLTAGHVEWATLLPALPQLRSLILRDNMLSDGGVAGLAAELHRVPLLEDLDLGNNAE